MDNVFCVYDNLFDEKTFYYILHTHKVLNSNALNSCDLQDLAYKKNVFDKLHKQLGKINYGC